MSHVRQRTRARVRTTLLVAAPIGVALLLGGCTGAPAPAAPSASTASPSSPAAGPTTPPDPQSPPGTGLEHVPRIAAQLQPSVVTVLVTGGNGSGVVYTADGLILTNEHVVRGNQTVQIAFADGQRTAGRVVATDPITDLALVQSARRDLPPARFNTALPEVGSLAVVIGSPLGFQNSVTVGIVSGLHREIPGSAAQGQALVDLLQTDAAISPGNSGGAVADSSGRVIGISEAYIPPQAGAVALGFAIPAATAVDVAEQLRTTGRARHAFTGIVPAPITPAIAQQLALPSTDGVIVAGVAEDGPADRAGLRPGDVITALGGVPTRAPEDLLAELRRHRPGDTLRITVRTSGQPERVVAVTATDRPTAGS